MIDKVEDINQLPSIEEVKKRSQGLALLDAVIMPSWEFRYFSYNCNWDGNGKESMASMRDGSGSEYFIHFSREGIVGKVLCIGKSLIQVKQFIEAVPNYFMDFKTEPAFNIENATFYFWRGINETCWSVVPNNSKELQFLEFLVFGVKRYVEWAEVYYERKIDFDICEEIFESLNISHENLNFLNPNLEISGLASDISEIIG